MPYQPLYYAPGISKTVSQYAASKTVEYGDGRVALGRYTDSNWVRFTAGFPESIGGQVGIISNTGTAYSYGTGGTYTTKYALFGVPRSCCEWRDLNSNSWLMIATDTHLYTYNGTQFADVTPTRPVATGNLATTNPLTTSSGSNTVTVADAVNTYAVGDWVFLSAGSAVNGITIDGWYYVQSVGTNTYTINASTEATGSSSGGGTVAFAYPRQTLSNPYTHTSGSSTVTVNHPSHGCNTNDWVNILTSYIFTASGSTRAYGAYPVTVVDANNYTIQLPVAFSGTQTGVGGSIVVVCNVHTPGITPVNVGYGSGAYGTGNYGQSTLNIPTLVTGWTLAAYGSQMLSCPIGGTIYVYDPTVGGVSYPLLNAPTTINAMFVTPERFVVALGINGSYNEMAWCDQNSYTTWQSTITNTAESGRTLQGGSYFIGGLPVRNGASIIFTNQTTFQMSYSGDNNVYDTPSIADQCGLIGPFACVAYGENAYWMSSGDFWTWNGAVQQLPSDDIREWVFNNINVNYQTKCVAGLVRSKKEVWFFYPDNTSTGENTAYVIYHTDSQSWSMGYVGYSAWRDADLFTNPFGAKYSLISSTVGVVAAWSAAMGSVANIYQMEEGTNSVYETYLVGAPTDVSNGDENLNVFSFIPDFDFITGNLSLVVTAQYYPEGTTYTFGPYVMSATGQTPRIDTRIDGKLIGYQITNEVNGAIQPVSWRLGLPRVDAQPSGARR